VAICAISYTKIGLAECWKERGMWVGRRKVVMVRGRGIVEVVVVVVVVVVVGGGGGGGGGGRGVVLVVVVVVVVKVAAGKPAVAD